MVLMPGWRMALAGLLMLASSPAGATLFTILTNTNWSAIAGGPPTAADTILVKNGATLTVNVTNAVAGAITLGGGAPSAGQGTLSFSANTSAVTLSSASGQAGTLTLGGGGNAGNLNMTNGGTLTLAGFISSSVGSFTRGTGTIVLTGTNSLPTAAGYATYTNLRVSANTTSLGQNTTVAGNLDVSGGTLNTATRQLTVNGTVNVDGTLTLTNTTSITGTTTIGGTLSITSATGNKTFTGDVTVDVGGTWSNSVAGNIFLQGDLANNGTFTSGTATYNFTGSAAQTITGTNGGTTNFALMTLSNAAGLSLTGTHNITITTLLTLGAGKITTGANTVYISNGSAVSGAGTGRFIEGNLKKPISAGTNVSETYEVGGNTGSNYSPVVLTFSSVGTQGDVTVSTTSSSHPQIGSSGIDSTVDLNRWWTVTNNSVPGSLSYIASFTYVANEIDGSGTCATGAACPAAFVVMRYDGSDWNITTLAGSPTTTSATITGETSFGQFAIGEPAEYNVNRCTTCPSVGRFNAYDPPPSTAAGSVQGFIRTKTAGTAFTLRIVHMDNSGLALQNVNKDSIRIDFLDASNTGGTYTNNCSSAWPTIATMNWAYTANANFVDVPFPATLITNSYSSVRVKVTRTSGGTESGCSGDRFAIKPNDLVIQAYDTTWQTAAANPPAVTDRTLANTSATTGNVHAASTGTGNARPFTIRATGRNAATPTPATTTNYAGTPTVLSGFPTCGTLPATGCTVGNLSLGSWAATTGFGGVRSVDAHYSEVGTFNLRLEDRTFANVDIVDTTLANRTISSASVEIGRFVPDHFTFTGANSPVLQTYGSACASRSFTYIGQTFWFISGQQPTATLEARNGGDAVTTNYQGALFRLTPSGVAETYSNNSVGPTLDCKLTDLSAACSPTNGAAPSLTALTGANVGKATYSATTAGGVLLYSRGTSGAGIPNAPYDANISLTVAATDSTESATVGNPGYVPTPPATPVPPLTTSPSLVYSSIAFDGGDFNTAGGFTGGKTFLYGRLRMANAYGPHTVALPVGIETQYWNGSAFQLNSQDSCTTLARSNITLGTYGPNLDPCETMVSQATVTFTGGSGTLYLTAPGATALSGSSGTPIPAVAGSVLLTPNLGSSASGSYCPSIGASGVQLGAGAANKSYLQGAWTGATYTENPSARGTFGFYSAQPRNFIYFRENY